MNVKELKTKHQNAAVCLIKVACPIALPVLLLRCVVHFTCVFVSHGVSQSSILCYRQKAFQGSGKVLLK